MTRKIECADENGNTFERYARLDELCENRDWLIDALSSFAEEYQE